MNDSSATDVAGAGDIDERMPSFAEAFRVWLRIGLLSFGGPAGQIALLHKEVVDERHWIGERRFLHALSFCNLLPGPEAQQLATYLGWLLHGVKGGLAAGIIFILPGAIVMLGLSLLYALAGQVPVVDALFFGLKSAVLVFVVEAVLRIGRRALKGGIAWTWRLRLSLRFSFSTCRFQPWYSYPRQSDISGRTISVTGDTARRSRTDPRSSTPCLRPTLGARDVWLPAPGRLP